MKSNDNQVIIESFNVDEEFLYDNEYLFIKGYATALDLTHTLKALPLARRFHNGQYRKGFVEIKGEKYRLPYVLHVLKVASTLISLRLERDDIMSKKELDILIATALLHDSIEDASQYFPKGGEELMTKYHFPKEVYDAVKLVSKQPGYSEKQLEDYFNEIKKNKYALLVKLADRSHNVEDLYNMKIEKLHKYVHETRTYIYPLTKYGKANYPEFSNGFTILKSKIRSLTELTETLVDMYEIKLAQKEHELEQVRQELSELKAKTKTTNRKE